MSNTNWTPSFSRWRHGGWYVSNLHYPSGACGCVSSNYVDKKWRIVDDDRRIELNEPGDFKFPTRDAAARAEKAIVDEQVALAKSLGITLVSLAHIANSRSSCNADLKILTDAGLIVPAADGWLDLTPKGRILLRIHGYRHETKAGWTK